MNLIKSFPLALKDIGIAEKIFGEDVGAIKGKTTIRDPIQVVTDLI